LCIYFLVEKTTLETSEEDVDKNALETSEEDVDKTTLETSEDLDGEDVAGVASVSIKSGKSYEHGGIKVIIS
jgi:hypothetical protein